VRALLESRANPFIADSEGNTPMAIAKAGPFCVRVTKRSLRQCVAVLEVSPCLGSPLPP
jgi:hypothetical protein